MGRTFPTSAATPVMLENLHSITGKVRPFPADPQVSSIAPQMREALIAVHEAAPPEMAHTSLSYEQLQAWTSVQKRARPLAEQFQATVRGLRRDRFARRMAYWWFEASSMRWWRRTPEAGQAEAAAWTYLQQLPTGTCPRSGPREIRDELDTVLNDWDEKHAGDIAALTGLSRTLSSGMGTRSRG